MWEFLAQLLEKGGVIVVLFVLSWLAFGLVARLLWNDNKALRLQVITLQQDYTTRISDLQEKRVTDAREVTEQVVTHAANVDRSVEKLNDSLDMLIATLRKD